MDKIQLFTVSHPSLAHIVAKMVYQRFGVPVWTVEYSSRDGVSLEIEEDHWQDKEKIMGFMIGVDAVLGRFFDL